MKLKVIIGITIIVILGGIIYTYINKKNDGSEVQPITNETTTASAVTNTTKQSINQNNTTNNSNNTENVSSNNVNSNNSNVSSLNTIHATKVKSDNTGSSINNANTNNTISETSKNNRSIAQPSNSSNQSSITQNNNNTNSNAENLQPNNNAEVSKYFGNWVVGKQVGSTIGTGEIYKSYEGDKIILTKDLFSFQGTTIKDPIYYIEQVDFGGYFGESQYDNYGNVKIDAQGDLAMLLVRPKSDPYTKAEFADACPTLGIILSGDQLITHGGGDGGTAINDCNRIN